MATPSPQPTPASEGDPQPDYDAPIEPTPEQLTERKNLIDRQNWLAALLELHGDVPPATMRPFEEFGPPPSPPVEEQDFAEHPLPTSPSS